MSGFDRIKSKLSYIHKSSIIGNGMIAMAKSYINRGVKMGDYCIINTGAIVDHECKVGSGVHLMGGCYLAGRVIVEDFVSIGVGASIKPGVTIGKGAVIGVGAAVIKDVEPNTTVVGVPAKPLKS